MADLIVIGNGFDLAHNMKTSYNDFRQFLLNRHPEILESLEFYSLLDCKKLWSDFENNLSKIDVDRLFDLTLNATQKSSLDDDYYSGEDDGARYFLSGEIGFIHSWSEFVEEWITDYVDIPEQPKFIRNLFNDDNLYLTFNYTETLEYTYGVPDDRVMHIHGRCGYTSSLIMGHGDLNKIKNTRDNLPDYSIDPKAHSVIKSTLDYLTASFKNVNSIISENSQYFSNYDDVKDVHIVGFSFNYLDIPYIDNLLNSIKKDSSIYIYYYNETSLRAYKKNLLGKYSDRRIIYKDIACIKE